MEKAFVHENEKLLQEWYDQKNYQVEEWNKKSKKCILFFSSNGLYSPDQTAVLSSAMQNDKYEWKYVAKSPLLHKKFGKAIFIRDIYKSWYVAGINKDCPTVDSLVQLLLRLTSGYEVYTAGSSSGGYIATIVGDRLHACAAFNLSGQWYLSRDRNEVSHSFHLNRYQTDPARNKYYDILPELSGKVPILYFYPNGSDWDVDQHRAVVNCLKSLRYMIVTADRGSIRRNSL